MSRSRLFGAFVAFIIGACLACSESGSGSESNFQKCTTDADCDGGACINERCEAPPVASSTDGGGAAGTEGGASGGTAGSGGAGGAGASAGMFGTGGVVVGDGGLAAGVAEPCSISSGFPGDEFCILAPSADIGFQAHFGPPSYDQPALVMPYLLAQAVIEIDDCVYLKSPNASDVYVSEHHLRARYGIFEAVVMALGTAHPDGRASCEPGFDHRPLAWSLGSTTVDVPDGAEAPENAGLAMRIAPSTQLALRVHSLQTTGSPLLTEAWVNFVYMDPATVTEEIDPVLLVAGTTAQVPQFSTQVVQGSCTAPADVRILDLWARGHVPSGERVTIWKVSGTTRTVVYESYGVDFQRLYYDSVHPNAQPDPTSGLTGGHSGVLDLAQGESLEWECEIVNSGSQTIQFTEASPACRIYGRYAPSFGGTWSCINP